MYVYMHYTAPYLYLYYYYHRYSAQYAVASKNPSRSSPAVAYRITIEGPLYTGSSKRLLTHAKSNFLFLCSTAYGAQCGYHSLTKGRARGGPSPADAPSLPPRRGSLRILPSPIA